MRHDEESRVLTEKMNKIEKFMFKPTPVRGILEFRSRPRGPPYALHEPPKSAGRMSSLPVSTSATGRPGPHWVQVAITARPQGTSQVTARPLRSCSWPQEGRRPDDCCPFSLGPRMEHGTDPNPTRRPQSKVGPPQLTRKTQRRKCRLAIAHH